ncbi:hypothetical protein [Nonomuraea rubra]|uniref:Uncharacterized protein n=1 Tax=Nonomuraea rubra TaxID=46180 RepID=A0A7X0NPC7_9ACTN|nr:hypothetical protein [Nonomuraea rubra]MBB6547148.1 hypothetical protein [Nonomuraea rubra]
MRLDDLLAALARDTAAFGGVADPRAPSLIKALARNTRAFAFRQEPPETAPSALWRTPIIRDGLLHLPRFSPVSARSHAATHEARPTPAEWRIAEWGLTCHLIEAGRGRMRFTVEAEDLGNEPFLPVTVTTEAGERAYVMIFTADPSGLWAGQLLVPDVSAWADVTIRGFEAQPGAVETVRLSVLASPPPWRRAWLEVATRLSPDDPVRQAIENPA